MNIPEKLERINELQNQLKIERQKAFEQYEKIRSEINSEYRSILDYELKYIKLRDHIDENSYTYIFCHYVHIGNNLSGSEEVTFAGYGFRYSLTDYEDDTWLQWDERIEQKYFTYLGYDTILKYITVITEQEFNEAFQTMMSDVCQRHKDNIENIRKDIRMIFENT